MPKLTTNLATNLTTSLATNLADDAAPAGDFRTDATSPHLDWRYGLGETVTAGTPDTLDSWEDQISALVVTENTATGPADTGDSWDFDEASGHGCTVVDATLVNAIQGGTDRTIYGVIVPGSASVATRTIFGTGNSGNSNGITFGTVGAKLRCYIWGGSANEDTAANVLTSGVQAVVAYRITSAGQLTMFVDGSVVHGPTAITDVGAQDQCAVGATFRGVGTIQYNWDGEIKETFICDAAHSDTEVESISTDLAAAYP